MKRVVIILALVWAAAAATNDLRQVAPGLTYEKLELPGPISAHVINADPKTIQIRPARALSAGIGRETVSSMARRQGALAAVNGGFFVIGGKYDGDPTGLLKIGRDWFSDARYARAAIGWTSDGSEAFIGQLAVLWAIRLPHGGLPVDGINRSRPKKSAVLYNAVFNRSTLTDPGGTEVIVAGNVITEIRSGGDSVIPRDGFVYSAGPDFDRYDLSQLKVGMAAEPYHRFAPVSGTTPVDWSRMDYLVSGTPVLIRKGEPVKDFSEERVAKDFVTKRHPRTAVGIRRDGRWVFVVADGRHQSSVGMTLSEMTDLLLSRDCVEALNLDGGGSSTLYLEGTVRNRPSDLGLERPVSDAILMIPR